MHGLGTFLNVGTIVFGTLLGSLLGNRFPARMRETIADALGVLVVVLGVSMALTTEQFLVLLGSLLLGAVTGELLGIERGLEWLGDWFQRRLSSQSATFGTGFVSASLLFCVGPMSILGSIQDGLDGDIQVLAIKAAMDGIAAVAFSATLGWGVGLSALSVLLYQGAFTLAAGLADKVLSEAMITEMTAAGGVLIVLIGLRLLSLKDTRVGNVLPALIYAPLLVVFADWVSGFF